MDRCVRLLDVGFLGIVGGLLGAGRREGCEDRKGRCVCSIDLVLFCGRNMVIPRAREKHLWSWISFPYRRLGIRAPVC